VFAINQITGVSRLNYGVIACRMQDGADEKNRIVKNCNKELKSILFNETKRLYTKIKKGADEPSKRNKPAL
jgi:hypothetical protein